MVYQYIELILLIFVGLSLIIFRKQIVSFQKVKAEQGKGLVNNKLKSLSVSHLEAVSIFGGLLCLTGALLTLVELIS